MKEVDFFWLGTLIARAYFTGSDIAWDMAQQLLLAALKRDAIEHTDTACLWTWAHLRECTELLWKRENV